MGLRSGWYALQVARGRRQLTRELGRLLAPDLDIRVFSDASVRLYHVGFARRHRTMFLRVAAEPLFSFRQLTIERVSGIVHILKRLDPRIEGIAEFSDGDSAASGVASMCSNVPDSILIPDAEFMLTRGHARLRAAAANARPFAERPDLVLWRGVTTGQGTISADGMTAATPGLLPRTRMCLLLRDVAGCDVKISAVRQSAQPKLDQQRLERAGIMDNHVDPTAWLDARYHIAIDGNSLAWSSTFTRLLTGCCILKPDSPGGYRQWYSGLLQPWQHYVPVASDLGNLVERIAWCRANPQKAAGIAAAGQAVAMAMTYDSETEAAVRRLEAAFDDGSLKTDSRLAAITQQHSRGGR